MKFDGPPTSWKEATYRTVHQSPGFATEQIAEHLNVRPSTLYSMANRNMPEVELPRKHLEPIVEYTRNPAFAEYLAWLAGGVFVAMPTGANGLADVVGEAAAAMDETSHVFQAVADSLRDGQVQGRELDIIEAHARHVQVAMCRVVLVARRDAEGIAL